MEFRRVLFRSSHESEEGVDIRMSLASMIDATNQYRTAKQKLLNQEMAKINPDLIHKIGDFAQTIIPLATASMTSKAVEELNGQQVWSRIKEDRQSAVSGSMV